MDRQQLIERHNRVLAIAKRAEPALKKLPHVVSVGIGFRTVGGKTTDDVGIVVTVDEKVPRHQLAPEHVIPDAFEGVKTDVIPIPQATLVSAKTQSLTGGTAINQGGSSYGTLGCCVTITASGAAALLSNQHVLEQDGSVYSGTGKGCGKAIATRTTAQQSGTVDAAVATLTSNGSATATISGLSGNITGINTAVVGEAIQKSGATSGVTSGTVKVVGTSISASGVNLTDQMILEGADPNTDEIVQSGDSGSVVVNSNMEVIGLVWAAHTAAPFQGYANTIQNVIAAMGITVPWTASASATATAAAQVAVPVAAAAPAPGGVDDVGPDQWGPLWDQYSEQLSQYRLGAAYVDAIVANQDEVQELVHHNRAVTLAWNTNQGPGFAQVGLGMVKDPQQAAQKTVNGVTVQTALENMIVVLLQNGSPQLQQAITTYSVDATNYIDCNTFQDILNIIQQSGPASGS